MAKQYQPAVMGGGGTHRPEGQARPRSLFEEGVQQPSADEDIIQHDFETEDIEGNRVDLDEIIAAQPQGGYGAVDVPLSHVYDPNNPDGRVGRFLARFILSQQSYPNKEDSYNNNFIINLHNYQIPLPLPLQQYVTDFDITTSMDAPYMSCSFLLKMPLSMAMDIFEGPGGHPEPGQWLCVRHLPNDNDKPHTYSPDGGFRGQGYGLGLSDLQFLGTITSLEWNVAVDEVGDVMASLSVNAHSFVHNLFYAEYGVKNAIMNDQTEGEYITDEEAREQQGDGYFFNSLNERDEDTSASEKYFYKWSDWHAFITQQAKAAVGQVSLKQSLSHMMKTMAYPELPMSIHLEPTDFASLYTDILYSPGSFVDKLKQLYIKDNAMGAVAIHGAIALMEILQIENPVINSTAVTSMLARAYQTASGFLFNQRLSSEDYSDVYPATPDGGDTVREVNELRRFLQNPDDFKFFPITIGDIVHIATTRDDIPPSHPLWGTMPHQDLPFVDMNRVKNYNMRSTTVWDLIRGTFQPDNYMIELYPVILNASARDVAYYQSGGGADRAATTTADRKPATLQELLGDLPAPIDGPGGEARALLQRRDQGGGGSRAPAGNSTPTVESAHFIKPFHRNIGGIPTVILRLKPVHPMIGREGINKKSIDKQKAYNKKQGATHFSYINDIQYKLASEEVKDPATGRNMGTYKDNSFGQRLPYPIFMAPGATQASTSNPDYDSSMCLPPFLHHHEIISMTFGQTDRARINSVQVHTPQLRNMNSRNRYVLEGEMIHNVEMALRHGWRSFKPTWPYDEYRGSPNTKPADMTAENIVNRGRIATALSERAYLTFGDDQMFMTGVITAGTVLFKSITPGCWLEIALSPDNPSKTYDYASPNMRSRRFLCYVKSVVHSYDIDPVDGTLTMTTQVGYERGSFGGITANIPSYKGPTIDVKQYMETMGLNYETGDALTSHQAQRARAVPIPQFHVQERHQSVTQDAVRAYVALRLGKGDITFAEAQNIIQTQVIPRDDYTLYQNLVERFGGNDGHDTDGVD